MYHHILNHKNKEKFSVLAHRGDRSIMTKWFCVWFIIVVIVIIIFTIFAVHELPLSKNDILCYVKANNNDTSDAEVCVIAKKV